MNTSPQPTNSSHETSLNKNLLLAKLNKFVAMKDTVGFVKDTETIEDLNRRSTPNQSRNAENAKMI
mgnify:CR=1 FL=1